MSSTLLESTSTHRSVQYPFLQLNCVIGVSRNSTNATKKSLTSSCSLAKSFRRIFTFALQHEKNEIKNLVRYALVTYTGTEKQANAQDGRCVLKYCQDAAHLHARNNSQVPQRGAPRCTPRRCFSSLCLMWMDLPVLYYREKHFPKGSAWRNTLCH